MPPSRSDDHLLRRSSASIDTANEEWREKWVEEAATTTTTVSAAVVDPTNVEVDVDKNISPQDLQTLKKQDPFLYYSLPGVRDATMYQKQVDMHEVVQNGLTKAHASCPACIGTTTTAKVKRCTRVSYECAADVQMADLMQDLKLVEKSVDDGKLNDYFTELFGYS